MLEKFCLFATLMFVRYSGTEHKMYIMFKKFPAYAHK